jgi:hypothetical protein
MVLLPPSGFVIALQFYEGDMPQALRLARLLADIELEHREDVTIALCPRFDVVSRDACEGIERTLWHLYAKFPALVIQSTTPTGIGHPEGPNGLWAHTFGELARMWSDGLLDREAVMFIEPDGCPLRTDWIEMMLLEADRAFGAGKRVVGALMTGDGPKRCPHVNGTLLAHLSMWADRPSIHSTPQDQAWDLFHARVLVAEAMPTTLAKNVYGATEYTAPVLASMARATAWIASTKDQSTIEWAERTLVGR